MAVTTSRTESVQAPPSEPLDGANTPLVPDPDPHLPLRRFTVDEYHKMIEPGSSMRTSTSSCSTAWSWWRA